MRLTGNGCSHIGRRGTHAPTSLQRGSTILMCTKEMCLTGNGCFHIGRRSIDARSNLPFSSISFK